MKRVNRVNGSDDPDQQKKDFAELLAQGVQYVRVYRGSVIGYRCTSCGGGWSTYTNQPTCYCGVGASMLGKKEANSVNYVLPYNRYED